MIKSLTKYQLTNEFEKVMAILSEYAPLPVIQNVFAALYPERAELKNRIRSCEPCNKVFWASNINSFSCSRSCRNAMHQRRHRQKNKEAINEHRRAVYHSRKSGVEISGA